MTLTRWGGRAGPSNQGRVRAWLAVGAVIGPLALGWSSATAQDNPLGGDGESPIEVLSDDGIEWRRDEQLYIARGNAVAIQGEDKVFSDVLLAHYRETDEGSTEIWRMEGHGAARIESPDRVVTGDVLVYEVDSGILVVTGEGLRMETPDEVVTARDSLEYWSQQRMAVARGDAYAERANGDIIQADVLTGYFSAPDEENEAEQNEAEENSESASGESAGNETGSEDGEGGNTGPMGDAGGMDRMEAFGNVVITTPQEVVRGDRAVYDVTEEIATVVDNVTISTATDQLAGERAVMNLKTGVSRLLGTGSSDGRARALIVPQGPRTEPVTPNDTGTDMAPASQ